MQASMRVESYNMSTGSQDVSPDRVFDFEAASCSTPSPEEAQQLQLLREKLEKEFEEVCPQSLAIIELCSGLMLSLLVMVLAY